jgi:hypothetical protein
MFGATDMGPIAVEGGSNNGANWISIWSQIGHKRNQWLTAGIYLSAY